MPVKTIAAIAAVLGLAFLQYPARALAAEDADASPKRIYVMRHLQKAAGDDPSLTEEGAILARMVAGMLGGKDFGIKAVFATRTNRAMQTGAPLARLVGVPVTAYEPRDVRALVAAVGAVPGHVLIVGHSNTVPDIVAAFGGTKPSPLSESDYGTIYQVTSGSPRVREFFVPPAPQPLRPAPERGR